jgi:hypothetical protein
MNAIALSSAAPPHAVKVWCDDHSVFAEVPSIHGPCVVAFPLSEGGLSRCLALLGAKHTADVSGAPYLRPAVIAKALMRDGITQRELDAAREALLELGMIK